MLRKKQYFCLIKILSICFNKEVFNFVNIAQHAFWVCSKEKVLLVFLIGVAHPPVFLLSSSYFFKMCSWFEINSALRFMPLKPAIMKSTQNNCGYTCQRISRSLIHITLVYRLTFHNLIKYNIVIR